ncbi:MAG: hypothetical protein JXA77_00415 [Bacteroidales bacterium]|nr:hypothetical protein [Bacteroidales bacterium]MBN2817636.1 hypothetical protein [Bacteroidales bacterium]
MIRNLTYKQIFIGYSVAILLSVFFIIKIAVAPTIQTIKTYKYNTEKYELISSASGDILLIKKRRSVFDSMYNKTAGITLEVRKQILSDISSYCSKNSLQVHTFPEQHIYQSKLIAVETNTIIIKGNFKGLLKLINYIESSVTYSKISSVNFYTTTNRKLKTEELFLELIFQNINNDEYIDNNRNY